MPRTVATTRGLAAASGAASTRTTLGSATQPSHAVTVPAVTQDFEGGWAKVSGGGTADHATERVKTGTNSLKCVQPGSGGNLFAGATVSLNFATLQVASVSMWVYVEFSGDATTTQLSFVLFFSADGFSNSLSSSATNMSLNPGWNLVHFGRSDFGGTGSWTATQTGMRVRVTQVAGQTTTMHFDSLRLNYRSRSFVMLDFDDIHATTATEAEPYMTARGIVGNGYLTSDNLDQSGYVTTAQVNTLYAAGWDISNHTDDHTNLKTLTQAQNLSHLSDCDTVLIANGWTRSRLHGAWPNGGYSDNGDLAAAELGLLTMRATQGGPGVPPEIDSQYRLGSNYINGLTENSAATLLAHVDRAIAGGYSIRFVIHALVAGVPDTDETLQISVFQAFIDGLVARISGGRLGNCTWSEYYAMTQGSGRLRAR